MHHRLDLLNPLHAQKDLAQAVSRRIFHHQFIADGQIQEAGNQLTGISVLSCPNRVGKLVHTSPLP